MPTELVFALVGLALGLLIAISKSDEPSCQPASKHDVDASNRDLDFDWPSAVSLDCTTAPQPRKWALLFGLLL